MNQTQRKYLIDKITVKTNATIRILEKERLDKPNLGSMMKTLALSGKIELLPSEEVIESIVDLVKSGRQIFEDGRWNANDKVEIPIMKLFKIPPEFQKELDRVNEHNAEIDKKINELKASHEMLEMRVQLASPKILSQIISEVDDMGQLSLVNEKMTKLLGDG